MLVNMYPDVVWEFWHKCGRDGSAKMLMQHTLKMMLVGLGFDVILYSLIVTHHNTRSPVSHHITSHDIP